MNADGTQSELAVDRPLPVLSRKFEPPQIGEVGFLDLFMVEAGGG